MRPRRVHPRPGVEVTSLTHPGRVRRNNEDSFGYFEHPDDEGFAERGRLAVVADGMGGQAAGEVASAMAVRILREAYYSDAFAAAPPDRALTTAIQAANQLICAEASRDEAKAGMGTTVTALLIRGRDAWLAHVGDSRAYLLRRSVLRQVTEDHSQVWALLHAGYLDSTAMKGHPLASSIYRSLGGSIELEVDTIGPLRLEVGDLFLLCSDGLSDMVPDEMIAAVLRETTPGESGATLVARAKERGGRDNVTVQLVRVTSDPPPGGAKRATAALARGGRTAVSAGGRRFRRLWRRVARRG